MPTLLQETKYKRIKKLKEKVKSLITSYTAKFEVLEAKVQLLETTSKTIARNEFSLEYYCE
jgi:hypothetical protein